MGSRKTLEVNKAYEDLTREQKEYISLWFSSLSLDKESQREYAKLLATRAQLSSLEYNEVSQVCEALLTQQGE